MNETTKESKFLDAINRYAEKQKVMIGREVEEYKAEKIEQATEAGLQDAYQLIQRDIARRKSAIVTEYAQKKYDLRRSLFLQRQRMMDEVFAKATEKLLTYTSTDAYREGFLRSAKKAAELVGDVPCVVLVNARDLALANDAAAVFAQATVQEDNSVRIGGVKVLCEEKGVLIDDTLDSRLDEQRQRFPEYAGLKVV